MKATSITGIVISGISFLCMLAWFETDIEAAAGWGVIATIYLLVFSIVALVKSK